MSNSTAPKLDPLGQSPQAKPRPTLKLVTSQIGVDDAPVAWIVAGFVTVVGVAVAVLMALSVSTGWIPDGLDGFARLKTVYEREGSARFLEEKDNLRERVSGALSGERASAHAARQIALYLFPDLLEEGDFEAEAAIEIWAPLIRAIERAPRTSESRVTYERLRAEIWNFESPRRDDPQLTRWAEEVLRLYGAMAGG